MKHEPDCGCLTCYQALRKFRAEVKALVEEIDSDAAELASSKKLKHQVSARMLRAFQQRLSSILAESEPERPEDLDVCPGCGVTARHLCEFLVDLDGKPHDCEDEAELPPGMDPA